jgi:hypothetical protein
MEKTHGFFLYSEPQEDFSCPRLTPHSLYNGVPVGRLMSLPAATNKKLRIPPQNSRFTLEAISKPHLTPDGAAVGGTPLFHLSRHSLGNGGPTCALPSNVI